MKKELKIKLLKIARETIEKYIRDGVKPKVEAKEKELCEKRGAFVTLKKHGELRGCIGTFSEDKPLYEVIQEMSLSSALQDPRFFPVTEDELPDIEIEISVLTPLREIKSTDEIEVGKHGLYIIKGIRGGVLLPQVATEQGWTKEEFLNGVCLKAGLPTGAWKDPQTKILVFEAEVFSEKEMK